MNRDSKKIILFEVYHEQRDVNISINVLSDVCLSLAVSAAPANIA